MHRAKVYHRPMEPRIHVITLGVADVARARKFYCDGLGFSPAKGSNDHVVFMMAGGVVLALYGAQALADDAHLPLRTAGGFGGIALARNVREKGDVAAYLEQARAAGGTILKPAQDVFWGGHAGYFADPDGHAWEIAWNPHWTIAADGSITLEPSRTKA